MLGVTGIGTGVTFGTAGVAETAVVCGFGVTGIVGVAVNSTIAGAYLVAVFGQDTYHHSSIQIL